jgi:tetratricopeptide (TPR) repeat protein
MVYLELGDVKQSEGAFKKSLELSDKHDEKWIKGTSRIYLGVTIAKNDKSKINRAAESILQGINILDERKIKPWSSIGYYNLGSIQADSGKVEKAIANLKKAENFFNEMTMNFWLDKTRRALAGLN